jgi:hypothetical protein
MKFKVCWDGHDLLSMGERWHEIKKKRFHDYMIQIQGLFWKENKITENQWKITLKPSTPLFREVRFGKFWLCPATFGFFFHRTNSWNQLNNWKKSYLQIFTNTVLSISLMCCFFFFAMGAKHLYKLLWLLLFYLLLYGLLRNCKEFCSEVMNS